MVVSIHQPDYIPYIGLFYKISQADAFVFLDDCQYSNANTHNWNRIKTPSGECRLKVPVEQHLGDPINGVRTRDELSWKERHLRTLEMNYSKAGYYHDFFPVFKELLLTRYDNLADMNVSMNEYIAERFGLKPRWLRSSGMAIRSLREKRVLDICSALGATEYISGNGARAYQVETDFADRGIKLTYTNYHPIEYRQLWGGFLPYLSIVDYIMNCGYDWDYIDKTINQ